MQKIELFNSEEESIEISYSGSYRLSGLTGLSATGITLLSTQGYKQHGETTREAILKSRSIAFNITVNMDTGPEAYEARRKLIKFANPLQVFKGYYTNDHMKVRFYCRWKVPPDAKALEDGTTSNKQTLSCVLKCDNPFLLGEDDINVGLAVVVPNLEFPIQFTGPMEFSSIKNKRVVIDNKGDVETPVTILCMGGVTNPTITCKHVNSRGEEVIKKIIINHIIPAESTLLIETEYNKEEVSVIDAEGSKSDAWYTIDPFESDIIGFNLQVGENEMTYDAEEGADSAKLIIIYSERYVGV